MNGRTNGQSNLERSLRSSFKRVAGKFISYDTEDVDILSSPPPKTPLLYPSHQKMKIKKSPLCWTCSWTQWFHFEIEFNLSFEKEDWAKKTLTLLDVCRYLQLRHTLHTFLFFIAYFKVYIPKKECCSQSYRVSPQKRRP